MNCPDLTPQIFIAQFPEFEGNQYIDAMLARAQNWFDLYEMCLKCRQKQYLIFLLAAHLLSQQEAIANGDTTGGIQTGASIDKISVSVAPAPYSDTFEYWLSGSRYGQELLGFLEFKTITPVYFGGSFQRVLR